MKVYIERDVYGTEGVLVWNDYIINLKWGLYD